MLFPEEDAPLLRTWIVKRIENTSDADADVLADYIIALLKHDADPDSVRKLCEQEIPDFLTEDTKVFLDDVFQAITYKSYRPGAPPPPSKDAPAPIQQRQLQPEPSHSFDPSALPYDDVPFSSRKRHRDDFDAQDAGQYGGGGGRANKQARKGGRGGRQGLSMRPDAPPFDPGNPMDTFFRMQAMFPQLAGFAGAGVGAGAGGRRGQPRRRGRCRDFDTKGYCSRGSTCMYDHGNESIFVQPMVSGHDDYDPNDAVMSMANWPQMNPFNFPHDPNQNSLGRGGRRGGRGKKGSSRAPFSAEGPVNDRTKTTIVVENIPEEDFSADQVRSFFSQFGEVVDVSMQPYKHLAIVKYDAWASANAAYRSPKVIFDNRFVKVFWYKDEGYAGHASGANGSKGSVSINLDHGHEGEQEPELDLDEFNKRQEEAQKQYREREVKRAELEQKRQELERQQQELLAKHREENERLRAKLLGQNGGGNGSSSGADMLRAKLAALEQEAKILGLDPNAIDDASDAGGSSTMTYQQPRGGYRGRGPPRGRGGFPPWGRGSFRGRGGMHAAYAQYSIDNRPKKLAVKGVDFTVAEKDEQLRHFLLNLGEFESVDSTPEVTHVSFADRKTAEQFYSSLNGRELPGVEGKLDLEWVNTPIPPIPTGNGSSTSKGPGSGFGLGPHESEGAMDMNDDEGDEDGEIVEDRHEYGERGGAEMPREERQVNMDYEVAEEDGW